MPLHNFSRALLCAGLLALASLAQAQSTPPLAAGAASTATAPERAGTAKLVKGPVTVFDGSSEKPLLPGQAVAATDRVSTGPGGSASLVLRDGTVIVLGPDSRMELREFAFDSTTYQGSLVVGVLRGTMRMVSGLIRKTRPDAVRIETPTALIGIRGTDFIVDVDPAGEGS